MLKKVKNINYTKFSNHPEKLDKSWEHIKKLHCFRGKISTEKFIIMGDTFVEFYTSTFFEFRTTNLMLSSLFEEVANYGAEIPMKKLEMQGIKFAEWVFNEARL
jgi:hypothetical protein